MKTQAQGLVVAQFILFALLAGEFLSRQTYSQNL